jgi:hypothetical protein
MRFVDFSPLFIACLVGGAVNASERLSGSILLTAGTTDIGPKSAAYDFSDKKIKVTISLDSKYFFSLSHSASKHSSTGRDDTIKNDWYKLGYELPLSGVLGAKSLSSTKVFATIGYFTSDYSYAGRFPDNTSSGTSYSIGINSQPTDNIKLNIEFTPSTYNSGNLSGKTQQVTDISATYFLRDDVGLVVGYRDVNSRWAGAVDATGWSAGIELGF